METSVRNDMESRFGHHLNMYVMANDAPIHGELALGSPQDRQEMLAERLSARVIGDRPKGDADKGCDFSRVRIHTDVLASRSASALDAEAYSLGSHILFQAGRYAPDTHRGRWLLAHELGHVVGSVGGKMGMEGVGMGGSNGAVIRRMSVGRGDPPNWGERITLLRVPREDRSWVNRAIALVRNVVGAPRRYPNCHRFFADRCPGGTPQSMANTFSQAVLWKMNAPGDDSLARGEAPGTNIAYSQGGYNQGAEGLARILVHEMMHNCGISGRREEHYLAEVAAVYCMGAGRNILGVQLGSSLSGDLPLMEILSYRRILGELSSGHIQPVVGGDIDLSGLIAEGLDPEGARGSRELGSVMMGYRLRSALLWGGERYGGLIARVETGVGLGRFRLRTAEGQGSALAPTVLLQVGAGAEFSIPMRSGLIFPMSLEAAYRLVQPVNEEARRIHSLTLGISTTF